MADSLEGLNPQLRAIIEKILAESGGKVTISSGRRTRDEQQRLYDLYKSGKGNLAARPGTSKHEDGDAVDFGGDLELAGQLAKKYGLVASVPGEPWHFTLGGEGAYDGDDMDPYDRADNPGNPQDVLANRLHSILKIVGQSPDSTNVGSPSYEDDMADQEFAPADVDGEQVALNVDMPKGGPVSAAKAKLQQYARKKMMEVGFDPSEFAALVTLWNKESGWDPNADNPTSTAFGIAQFLNGTWAGTGVAKTNDPFKQIDAGLTYIKQRYGSPAKALQFHLKNNWY